MQIFNISDLFATPVAAAATATTLNKNSRKRRRKAAQIALPNAEPDANNSGGNNADVIALRDGATSAIAIKKKRPKKKRGVKAADEPSSVESSSTNPVHSSSERPVGDAACNATTKSKATENLEEEVKDLLATLELITSQRNALEKSLNELREDNDRLARNNEDLKDELKEMTDETLELSVEKQRLLSKIGTLRKQLLNRPK